MKNIILFFIVYLIANQTQAQSLFDGASVQANGITFLCEHFSTHSVVRNQQSGFQPIDTIHTRTTDCMTAHLDKVGVLKIHAAVKEVFSATRVAALMPEKRITLYLTFNPQGQITHILYKLKRDTAITPSELAALEIKLKSLVFELKNTDCQMPFYHKQRTIEFSSLY